MAVETATRPRTRWALAPTRTSCSQTPWITDPARHHGRDANRLWFVVGFTPRCCSIARVALDGTHANDLMANDGGRSRYARDIRISTIGSVCARPESPSRRDRTTRGRSGPASVKQRRHGDGRTMIVMARIFNTSDLTCVQLQRLRHHAATVTEGRRSRARRFRFAVHPTNSNKLCWITTTTTSRSKRTALRVQLQTWQEFGGLAGRAKSTTPALRALSKAIVPSKAASPATRPDDHRSEIHSAR